MLLARLAGRASDFGIRRALGASKGEIFLQAICETGIIGMLGGCISLPLVQLGVMVIRAQQVDFSELATIPPEGFLGVVITALVIGVTVGVIPALRVCRLSPAAIIKSGAW
jgi:putative ABC transport system permease protein